MDKEFTTLTFRIQLPLKEALRTAAWNEHRSMTELVQMLIRDHCKRNKISIGTAPTKPRVKRKERKAKLN